mgnify:CR=1 FL=1
MLGDEGDRPPIDSSLPARFGTSMVFELNGREGSGEGVVGTALTSEARALGEPTFEVVVVVVVLVVAVAAPPGGALARALVVGGEKPGTVGGVWATGLLQVAEGMAAGVVGVDVTLPSALSHTSI